MKVFYDHNLKPHHTFGMDVYADEFRVLESPEEVIGFAIGHGRNDGPASISHFLILGGGSNVLFTQNFPGTVVKIATRGIEIVEENENKVMIQVQAGEDWDELVKYCVANSWGGLENLSGIPGNAGAGPIQNIGAYGTELKDHFHSLRAVEMGTGKLLEFHNQDCHFGYRDSIFKRELKGKVIILDLTLVLVKNDRPNLGYSALARMFEGVPEKDVTPMMVREAVLKIRAAKLPDPAVTGNAGSFFKNPVVNQEKLKDLLVRHPGIVYFFNPPPNPVPNLREGESGGELKNPLIKSSHTTVKLAAGWLIEQCGWKGYREGDAGVHGAQALVLVNFGNATGKQIFDLSEKIRLSVKKKFGLDLEREVNVV